MGRWSCQMGLFLAQTQVWKPWHKDLGIPQGEPWMGWRAEALVLLSHCLSAGGQ